MGTALLIIDVQRLLTDGLPERRRVAFLDTLAALLARARNAGAPVVFVRHEDEELEFGAPHWQIASEIAPRAGEPIVDKRFRDAFRNTNLAEVLDAARVDHVVACGMQSEFCVDATIREAERRGYRVTLVEDGHATLATEGITEASVIAHVHRVARDKVARIVAASALFTETATERP